MDRSLWLLTKLRLLGLLRRGKRAMSKPKGLLLGIGTAMLIIPWMGVSVAMLWLAPMKRNPEMVERFAPIALLVLFVTSILSPQGEMSISFAPAEVDFLFPGPYRRRQLVAYRLTLLGFGIALSALFFSLFGATQSPSFLSALAGLFLVLYFMQLCQMVIALIGSSASELARGRKKRTILLAVLATLAISSLPMFFPQHRPGTFRGMAQVIESSPIIVALTTPFRWFVHLFLAEDWASWFQWGAVGVAVDLAMVGAIFGLDASYIEASMGASARRSGQMQKLVGGGGGIRVVRRSPGRFSVKPPSFGWLGGVGPNLWRQMTVALASPGRLLVMLCAVLAFPILMQSVAKSADHRASDDTLVQISLGMLAYLSILLSGLFAYDFRSDIDVMDTLKMLPIAPWKIAMGQILTPALMTSLVQSIAVGTMALMMNVGTLGPVMLAVVVFLVPMNMLLFGIENLLFLWYPSRMVAGRVDLLAIGRQFLFLFGKALGLGLGLGTAAILGTVGYFASGQNVIVAALVAWCTVGLIALAILPMIGRAFSRFDMASDVPS